MVVHLNLRVGFEVIRHKHDGDLNMAQLVYLERRKEKEERDLVTGYLFRVRVFKSNVLVTRYGMETYDRHQYLEGSMAYINTFYTFTQQ